MPDLSEFVKQAIQQIDKGIGEAGPYCLVKKDGELDVGIKFDIPLATRCQKKGEDYVSYVDIAYRGLIPPPGSEIHAKFTVTQR